MKFEKALDNVIKHIEKMRKQAEVTKFCRGLEDKTVSYTQALRLEELSEKLVLWTRTLPAYTGAANASKDVENIINKEVPVDICFTDEGWFQLTIPCLLPRKEHGSVDYIRVFLYPKMREYFDEHEPVRFNDCVIIYRFVYDKERPERRMIDHDNYEINAVTDIVAMYLLPDDSPKFCNLYYTTYRYAYDATQVFIVPRTDLARWMKKYESGT